jgi:diaminopimelate epimerase
VKFVKMHGAGNDFLIVEAQGEARLPDGQERDWEALSQAMCERHFGAGADGVMLVMPSQRADVRMRLFNADGSEAEVSGNGVRCLVKYAVESGLVTPVGRKVTIEAIHDVLEAQVAMSGGEVASVTLSMGRPRFAPAEVPVITDMAPPILDMPIEVAENVIEVSCVSMGNPHAVMFSDEVGAFPLGWVGPRVEHHPAFPARVNFGVAYVVDRGRMDVRVWERGAGETLACGSGCCAAMVAARLKGLVGERVDITQPGGVLTVEWDGEGEVLLGGPAAFVFEGDWPE